jgi:hypothetical protein
MDRRLQYVIFKSVHCISFVLLISTASTAQPNISFRKHVVHPAFVSEGAATGDVNRDGRIDILAGIYWFEAPSWKKHLIHTDTLDPVPRYSTSFLNFSDDINNDGWIDLVRFNLPGAECVWYENPGAKKGLWKSRMILKTAGIESPAFVDVDLDGHRDIICNDIVRREVIWLKSPAAANDTIWTRYVISNDTLRATHRYTHGLGWGDLNKDGRNDFIVRTGWWESPVNVTSSNWTFHPSDFGADCANMYAIDADGDGDADVVSSSAHDYGIWWYERNGSQTSLHEISTLFSQSHAMVMEDINSDGHPDLVTGKRYFAHNEKDRGALDPAVLYWFEFVPGKNPQWKPHMVDDNSGIGNNFAVTDINKDGLPDIIISNKKGVFFFEQVRSK